MARKVARKGGAPAPYTKFRKRPHRYSPAYYQWRDAVRRGNDDDIKATSAVLDRLFRAA